MTAAPNERGEGVNLRKLGLGNRTREKQQQLALQALGILSRESDMSLVIGDILGAIKEVMGFEAVGIRLSDGGDFPYYVTNGFPEAFVEAERFLCERDAAGGIVQDTQGNAVLECMCGNVIYSRFDPSKPFFTEGGSFWTNCTTELLECGMRNAEGINSQSAITKGSAERENQSESVDSSDIPHLLRRCNSAGYESVALISLRSGDEVIGLLQLNDHRKGMFTLDMIRFFEGLGAGIGIALSRRRAQEQLKFEKVLLSTQMEAGIDGILVVDENDRYSAPMLGSDGQYCGRVWYFRDITANRRAEENYRMLFRAMPSGLALHEIICDEKGTPVDYRFLTVNPAFERMTGLKAEQVVGRTVLEVLPGSAPDWIKTCARVALTGETAFFEHYFPDLRKHFEVTAYRCAPNRFVCIFVATTDKRRAAQEMQELRRELYHMERVQIMGELASSLAHEINQPLAGILSNAQAAQLLLSGTAPNMGEIAEILSDIVADNKRAGQVVSRIGALLRKEEPDRRSVDVNDAIRDVIDVVHSDAVIRNVSIVAELGKALPAVSADRVQIQQVVLNLVQNAGQVMTGSVHGEGRIVIQTQSDMPDCVRISVRDSGPGIDKDKLDKLFEAFYTTRPDGLGMGLSICRTIVMAHGGRIWLENNPDGGAAAVFTLPVEVKSDRESDH